MRRLPRLAAFLGLAAFWAAVAWAQNSPAPAGNSSTSTLAGNTANSPGNAGRSSSSAAGDTTSAPASNGAQQVPERPPAPVPAVVPPSGPAAEPGQTYVELKYNVDGTDLQGNKQRSFLHQGINHTAELSYFFNLPVLDIRRIEFLAVGRYTNNPQVDPERNSLQRFYARMSGPTFEANAGDYLVNYSRLTLNQNIRGLNIWKNASPKWRLTGSLGFFTDRWGSLYRPFSDFRNVTVDCSASLPGNPSPGCIESPPGSGHFILDPSTPAKPYSRLVGGARIERKVTRTGWFAANWSHGADLRQSLPEAFTTCSNGTVVSLATGCPSGATELPNARRPGLQSADNDVVSLDSRLDYEPAHLTSSFEYAYSWTAGGQPPPGATPTTFLCASQPPVVGGAVLDARCFSGRVGDSAARGEIGERVKKLSWHADYVRFQPNFFSANARQIQDLQEVGVRGDYRFIRQMTLTAGWRRSEDNLNGRRDFTNLVRAPEVRLTFQELPFYRRLVLDFGYRERDIEATGHPQPTELQKRLAKIPFTSVTLPFGHTRLSFDYEHRHEADAVVNNLTTDTDHFGFGLRGDYSWNLWEFSPNVRMELERLNKNIPGSPDPTLATSSGFFEAFDSNRSYTAGFLLEAPRHWRLEGEFREFNSVILSPLQATSTVPFFFLNQGFKRPSWRAAVTYKIANDENKRITFFYLRTNNFFDPGFQLALFPGTSDTRSFRETVIGGTILLRYRK
jgi:hypothetical protein